MLYYSLDNIESDKERKDNDDNKSSPNDGRNGNRNGDEDDNSSTPNEDGDEANQEECRYQKLCRLGKACRFKHIDNQYADCNRFNYGKGYCRYGERCRFSHEIPTDKRKTIQCKFQARGNCTNTSCPYKHTRPQIDNNRRNHYIERYQNEYRNQNQRGRPSQDFLMISRIANAIRQILPF